MLQKSKDMKRTWKPTYVSMSYSVCDVDTRTSTPSDSNKRFTESSRLWGNGSPSYSNVTLVIFHCLISFGKTSIGWPRTMKRRELSFRRLLSKSSKQSKRNRHLVLDILISFKESTSRKNTALKVELPSIAKRRDGLSCNLNPFLNQWSEFTLAFIFTQTEIKAWYFSSWSYLHPKRYQQAMDISGT